MVAKLFSLKIIPTKPSKGDWETKPEVLNGKCGLPDCGERDPVRIFEEWLASRPHPMGNSGPLYLAIIPRYEATMTSSVPVQKSPATMSSTIKENIPANPYGSGNMIPFFTPSQSVTMATKHLQQAPFQVFNQCVFNTNNNVPSADPSQSQSRRKRHRIIDLDSD